MKPSSFDGSAVQLVPQNIEKLPLFHWRPGSRLLSVGSRDGARFDGQLDAAEGRTFRRELSVDLLSRSAEQLQTDGIAATWSNNLSYPKNCEMLTDLSQPLVVVNAGFGDDDTCALMLEHAVAWVLLIGSELGPHCERIIGADCHVEVVLGLPVTQALSDLPWEGVAAVHLVSQDPAAGGEDIQRWESDARALLPDSVRVYTSSVKHTQCRHCGETLVWRHGGRSRLDALNADNTCRSCGAAADFCLD